MIAWIDRHHSVVWSERKKGSLSWHREFEIWDDILLDGCGRESFDDLEDCDGTWMMLK